MSLYDTFKELHCATQQKLRAQYDRPQASIRDRVFEKQFSECEDRSFAASPYVGRLPHDPVCAQKPPAGETAPHLYGYEAYRGEFFQDPDRRYTFHNYLTAQEDGDDCANNHQFFENWTRKRVMSKSSNGSRGVPDFPEMMPTPPLCDVFKALDYSYSNVVGGNC